MAIDNCPAEDELIAAAMDKESATNKLLASHIQTCPACPERFNEIQAMLSGISFLASSSGELTIASPKPSEEEYPTAIDKYFVLGVLQEREDLCVFRGMHSLIPSDEVAIFLERKRCTDEEGSLIRLRSACLPLKNIKHPQIAPAVDIGFYNHRPYLLTQYLPGRSLKRIREKQVFFRREAAAIGAQLAEALTAAHRVGVIHGSLRLESITLTEGGLPRIIDFGVSHLSGAPLKATAAADISALEAIIQQLSSELPATSSLINSQPRFADAKDLAKFFRREARSGRFRTLFR